MALTVALLVLWLSACGWLQHCQVAAGNLAGIECKITGDATCKRLTTGTTEGNYVGLPLPFYVIVFLRLTDVLQRLLHQPGLLRRACVSPEGWLSCM